MRDAAIVYWQDISSVLQSQDCCLFLERRIWLVAGVKMTTFWILIDVLIFIHICSHKHMEPTCEDISAVLFYTFILYFYIYLIFGISFFHFTCHILILNLDTVSFSNFVCFLFIFIFWLFNVFLFQFYLL